MYMHLYKELEERIMFDLKYRTSDPFRFQFLNRLLVKTDTAIDQLSRGQSEITTLNNFYHG